MQENAPSGQAPVAVGAGVDSASVRVPEPANRAAIENLLNDYFTKQHDRKWNEHLKSRWTTLILRWVVGVIGVALFAAPIVKVILTEETDRQILGQPDGLVFLLPGLLLVAMSWIAALWSRGWPTPMLFAIAIAAFDVYYFDTGPDILIPFMVAVAALALAAGLISYVYNQRKEPKSLAELEKDIDDLTARQLKEFVRQARTHLPIPPSRFDGTNVHCLKCFPKRRRLNRPDILARIGTDKIPRMSPIGVCAFDFGEADVVVLEGAVDLKSGEAVYLSAYQFAYRDISSLIWHSDVWPKPGASVPGSSPDPATVAVRTEDDGKIAATPSGRRSRKPAVLRLEEFKILLKSAHAIEILFHDGSLAKHLEDKNFGPVEDTQKIRAVWEQLASKRSAASLR